MSAHQRGRPGKLTDALQALCLQARGYLKNGTQFSDPALRGVFLLFREWKRGYQPDLPPNFREAFSALEDVEWFVGRELEQEREARGYEFLARLLGARR